MDAFVNFGYTRVVTVPSPADSGTALVVITGDGAILPTPPFNGTVWPRGTIPVPSNAEIVRVTDITGDTLTIVRTQEGTLARSIEVGDQFAATITANVLANISGFGTHVDDVTPWDEPGFVDPATPDFSGAWFGVNFVDDFTDFTVGWGADGDYVAEMLAYENNAAVSVEAGNRSIVMSAEDTDDTSSARVAVSGRSTQSLPLLNLLTEALNVLVVNADGTASGTLIDALSTAAIGDFVSAIAPASGSAGWVTHGDDPATPTEGWIAAETRSNQASVVVGFGDDTAHLVSMSATATDAFLTIEGGTLALDGSDAVLNDSAHGLVLVDRSDGHTYRLKVDGGVLGVEQVS